MQSSDAQHPEPHLHSVSLTQLQKFRSRSHGLLQHIKHVVAVDVYHSATLRFHVSRALRCPLPRYKPTLSQSVFDARFRRGLLCPLGEGIIPFGLSSHPLHSLASNPTQLILEMLARVSHSEVLVLVAPRRKLPYNLW